MIKYIITARKWFDKINGNTYFSLKITDINNVVLLNDPFQYGYGEHYKDVAKDFLIKNKLLDVKDRYNHDLLRDILFFECSEVARKRDL